MIYLLDTHVLIWWWTGADELTADYGKRLDDAVRTGSRIGVSDITLWEIAMLEKRGRLRFTGAVDSFLGEVETHPMVEVIPITGRIAVESTQLGRSYPRDPADRIIGATARCLALPLMTVDQGIRDSKLVPLV